MPGPRRYKKRDIVRQVVRDDYILIALTGSGDRAQFTVSTFDDALEMMNDYANSDSMAGGKYELVWQGEVIAHFEVVW